jgi:hypothetical protein
MGREAEAIRKKCVALGVMLRNPKQTNFALMRGGRRNN